MVRVAWDWCWGCWGRRRRRWWSRGGGCEVGAGTVWLVHHAHTAHNEQHPHWDKVKFGCSLSGKIIRFTLSLRSKIFHRIVSENISDCGQLRLSRGMQWRPREGGQGRVTWSPGLPLAPSRHLTSSWPLIGRARPLPGWAAVGEESCGRWCRIYRSERFCF